MDTTRKPIKALLCAHAALIAAGLASFDAQAQLRIATYNTLDGPNTATEDALVQTIFGAIGNTSRNGIARPVDIIGLQEQATLSGPDTAERTAAALNGLYGVSSYQALIIDTGFDSLAYVYNSATVTVDSSTLVGVGIRPGHRVGWMPVGYTADSSILYTYNVHLKAGSTTSDVNQRANESTNLRNNADALGEGANIVYLGDFNMQAPTEQGFVNLTASGAGQAVDPLGLTFWNGIGNAVHHTQSTRTSALSDGGSPGGMDDRFDLQIVTGELLDGNGLNYIGPSSTGATEHSYQAFSNDGSTFDAAINAVTTGRSQTAAVNDALHDFSDHLPVVADYQLPALASFSVDNTPIRTIAGSFVGVSATVENIAPVSMDIGADTLDYTLTGSGSAFVGLGPFSDSLKASDAANEHTFLASAATAGSSTVSLTLTSNDQGATNGQAIEEVQVIGLDHAEASFLPTTNQDAYTIDFGQVQLNSGGGSLSDLFFIFNQEQTKFFTADLVIENAQAVSGDTGVFSVSNIASQIEATELTAGSVSFDTSSAGVFSAVYSILVSDEAIAGATSDTLTLTVMGEVLSSLLLGDADNDGDVDAFDITAVEQNFGVTGIADGTLLGDADDDGDVDAFDITTIEQNFGNTLPPASALDAAAAVPEPSSLVLLGLGGLLVTRRRRS